MVITELVEIQLLKQ